MPQSTPATNSNKSLERPARPEGFPLTAHPSGAWCKKIAGKLRYFGAWARRVNGALVRIEGHGIQEAMEAYRVHCEGPKPDERRKGLRLAELCDRFLASKERQYASGELSARMFKPGATPEQSSGEYFNAAKQLIEVLGGNTFVEDLKPDDFGRYRLYLAKRFGPVRLSNEVTRARSFFKFADDNGLIEKPVRFGTEFKKPSARVMRVHKAEKGKNFLEAHELRRLLDAARTPIKAFLLLGLNCGFGPADCARLTRDVIDLGNGWIDMPRGKTGMERRCPLWPETIAAIKDALANRPKEREAGISDLVFITARGRSWSCDDDAARMITGEVGKLMRDVGVHREGLGHYTCRHVFFTIGEEAGELACKYVMGHLDLTISKHYREAVADERLKRVTEHVRRWLWPDLAEKPTSKSEPRQSRAARKPSDTPQSHNEERPAMLRLYAG